MKKLRRILFTILGSISLLGIIYFIYMQGLFGVHPTTIKYYVALKKELIAKDYEPNYFILSTNRPKWFNNLLVQFGGAASKSQHIQYTAIDIIVLDVNNDGKKDAKDIDIVYKILDRKIIGRKGGVGTYKNESGFFNRQMIHFDSRGHKARWHR